LLVIMLGLVGYRQVCATSSWQHHAISIALLWPPLPTVTLTRGLHRQGPALCARYFPPKVACESAAAAAVGAPALEQALLSPSDEHPGP
jgi:hypothetical protein